MNYVGKLKSQKARKHEHYNTIITLYMKFFKVESLNKSYKRKQTIVLKHCSIVLVKKYKTSIDEYLRQINFSIQICLETAQTILPLYLPYIEYYWNVMS